MAKYEYTITIEQPEGADDPTLEEVRTGVYAGVQAAFPEAEVSVNDGNRPDVD